MNTKHCKVHYFLGVFLLITQYVNGNTIISSFNPNSNESPGQERKFLNQYDADDSANDTNEIMTTVQPTVKTKKTFRINEPILSSVSSATTNRVSNLSLAAINENTMTTDYAAYTNATIYTIESSTTMYTTEETTPSSICDGDKSTSFIVNKRNASMFIATIIYNCSSVNFSELYVFTDEIEFENCTATVNMSETMDYTIVNVTCDNIENSAGQNWTFSLGEKQDSNQTIFNEIFTVTLDPLKLSTIGSIDIKIIENSTAALIFIPNCERICNLQYLVVFCNNEYLLNGTLSTDCTHKCVNIEPGSIYNVSLIRLPIRIVDKNDNEPNNTFLEERLDDEFRTDLGKVSMVKFESNFTEKSKASIYFDCPRGYFDQIDFNCSANDRICAHNTVLPITSLKNCSSSSSITIFPIIRGVSYVCQATTSKENFTNVKSDNFYFNTSLEPFTTNTIGLTNTTKFAFNVTYTSDFRRINSVCLTNTTQNPCTNINATYDQCATKLEYEGILGCNYACYFITEKEGYDNVTSVRHSMHVYPPVPIINYTELSARSITINWTISKPVYFKSFEIVINKTFNIHVNSSIYSYRNTSLLPNRDYKFRVKIISNHEIVSEPLVLRTLEDAPDEPTDSDIINKIIPMDNDTQSEAEQYVVAINRRLFSSDNGVIRNYSIYVHQNQSNNNISDSIPVGSYSASLKNSSIAYLALNIPLSGTNKSFLKTADILPLIIGNETFCKNDSDPSIPCNGKLKSDTSYRLIVRACTNAGCTSVISPPFRTKILIPLKVSKSLGWIAVFPILVLLLVVAFFVLNRRKKIKQLYTAKDENSENLSVGANIQMNSFFKPMKPMRLINYININREGENIIYDEYEKLEEMSPQCHQTDHDPDMAHYNRYKNIPARGPWERTAVYLTGQHRIHDYINANHIISFDKKQNYIACQGPLKDTCEDFWDMILQYKVRKIVMLTRTEEQNQCKCHPYFPTDKHSPLIFNETTVMLINIENYVHANLEIRHLSIQRYNVKHDVIHYYFTGWPDFKVVDVKRLLALIQTVNKYDMSASSDICKTIRNSPSIPIVVHCSAGVGRTGTYISVDTIMRILNRPDSELLALKLDVMGIVYQLRQQRVKMVQTKEQYLLIYHCVEEYLRQTHRLDIILHEPHEYQNFVSITNTPDTVVYMNTPSKNNIRMLHSRDDPLHYCVNPERERLCSKSIRSNTVTSMSSRHSFRSHTSTKGSTQTRLKHSKHHKGEYDYRTDHIEPSLPPRRSTRAMSSVKNLHEIT